MIEGKDKEGNNLTFIRDATVMKNGEHFDLEIVGHSCSFAIEDLDTSL